MWDFIKTSRSAALLLFCLAVIGIWKVYMLVTGNYEPQRPYIKELFTPPKVNQMAGNPDGKITIVEFYDYNCSHTRVMEGILSKVLEDDKDVRIIYRAYNNLGGTSEISALAALAANYQNRFLLMRSTLLTKADGQLTQANILNAAHNLNLNTNRLVNDMARPELLEFVSNNKALAQKIGFLATPAFIIGNSGLMDKPRSTNYTVRTHIGEISVKGMEVLISEVRRYTRDD